MQEEKENAKEAWAERADALQEFMGKIEAEKLKVEQKLSEKELFIAQTKAKKLAAQEKAKLAQEKKAQEKAKKDQEKKSTKKDHYIIL